MRHIAMASLFIANISLSAAELPPPAVQALLAQELTARQLTRLDPQKLEIVVSADGDAYQTRIGTYLFFLSPEADFIFVNNFFEYAPDLTESERSALRRESLNALSEEQMIIFAPPQTALYTITVFTDASCPFCARFHRQVPILNQEGVKVRYLAFPREGLYTPTEQPTRSFQKTAAVWCSANRHRALAQAMLGKDIEMSYCDNPVEAFYLLGESFGVGGTPAIVFENGDLWVGYYSAMDILEYLGNHYFPPQCEELKTEDREQQTKD